MDSHAGSVAHFVPDRRFTVLAAIGVVLAAGLTVGTGDPAGKLMFGLAGLVLAAYALSDLVFSPRLVATRQGLIIRSVLTRASVPWSDVESVETASRDRLGLRSTTLEIDAGATLAVFSRRTLGADPEDAARRILATRPPR